MELEYKNVPSSFNRIVAVWKRHIKVYISSFGNVFPPLIEPLIFIVGMGLGLGRYIGDQIMNINYITYIAPGIAADIAVWTATFECTFGTFIRLNFDNIYHPIASTPVSVEEIFLGEILFTGTKGAIFTFILMLEMIIFGYFKSIFVLLIPVIGFLVGIIFGAIGLLVTSFVKTMNSLNFYISGFLLPMIFLSEVFFPITELPKAIQPVSYALPLMHSVRLMRACAIGEFNFSLIFNLLFLIVAMFFFSWIAIIRIRKRVII